MTALLLALLLGVAAPAPKVEKACDKCNGERVERFWIWKQPWPPTYMFSKCKKCDGYGKERTIYGELLRERR